MKQFVGDPNGPHRLRNLMDPAHPVMSGVVQKQDSYMKGKLDSRHVLYFQMMKPVVQKPKALARGSLNGRAGRSRWASLRSCRGGARRR